MRRLQIALLVASVVGGVLQCSKKEPDPAARVPTRLEHGTELYGRICAVCHGKAGEGYKADEATALAQPDFLASASDDFLRTAIKYGRSGTTMSAWSTERGGPLLPADVEDVIAYLRTWDHAPRAKLDDGPPLGDAAKAEALYTRECLECHGVRGIGGPNVHIGNLDLLASASNGFLRLAIRNGRTGAQMPAFGGKLGDEGVEDLIALLRNWQSTQEPAVRQAAHPPPLPLGPVPLNPKGPEPVGFKKYPENSGADVIKGQLDRGAKMVILDARAPSDYTNEHIAGAVSVPFYDPSPYYHQLPTDAWLVCYCSCPHAESGQLAQALVTHGFTKVTVLDEGLGVWKNRKYPVHTGEKP